jgi:hypothetical protein
MEVEVGYDEASKISRALRPRLAPTVLVCPFGGAYEPTNLDLGHPLRPLRE